MDSLNWSLAKEIQTAMDGALDFMSKNSITMQNKNLHTIVSLAQGQEHIYIADQREYTWMNCFPLLPSLLSWCQYVS